MPVMFHCGIGRYLKDVKAARQSAQLVSFAKSLFRTVERERNKYYCRSVAVYTLWDMQNGQMRANEAVSSISGEISCLPVSTAGTMNIFEQLLHATFFWPTFWHALSSI